MVVSMTGFGRSVLSKEQMTVTVEMKSVNHRFTEISIRLPRQLVTLEDKIKKIVQKKVNRGRVEMFISIEGQPLTDRSLSIDWILLDQYINAFHSINGKYELQEDQPSINQLLQLENMLQIEEKAKENTFAEELITQAVIDATEKLFQMRLVEGAQLVLDIKDRLQTLSDLTLNVEKLAPSVIQNYQNRIYKRVSEYMSGTIDEDRILTEVAVFADRSDISEELTRIKSHIYQFQEILVEKEPIGRKLDFLVQELNREANTIGSKANDSQIAKMVVEMKSIIEKMKEQVQNIE
ncbi:YicC/YloC family endoribonuclease [Metabacillus arenae]|uniref:YicC family protein n=1 Tax=Metabacillus arenae TaxID=2771434 RepID=A0A926NHA3_9BACI|nr:YicC/YloC family endoribonuclease [Metabacillus arenae]MBD1379988.1 YicC family protein [Metabacillus arenae]